MARPLVEVHEFYYGYGELRGDKTYIVCMLEPGLPPSRNPRNRLILDVAVPVEGPMVVETIRYAPVGRRGFFRKGCPLKAVGITYDPDPNGGAWRGKMKGSWPVRRFRIRRRSVWERLR